MCYKLSSSEKKLIEEALSFMYIRATEYGEQKEALKYKGLYDKFKKYKGVILFD